MGFTPVYRAAATVEPLDGTGNNVGAFVNVGFDLAADDFYVAYAGLDWREEASVFEYSFSIISDRQGQRKYYLRKRDLPWKVTRAESAHILEGVCRATVAVLNAARPERVYRVTCDAYGPYGEAGLAKHNSLSVVFASCGYQVEDRSLTPAGMVQWVMRRSSP